MGQAEKKPMPTGSQELPDQTSCKSNIHQTTATSPIFILGIAPRSGTNYLHDLIRNHPDCDPGSGFLEEDHLIANARLLINYIEGVSRWWKKKWGAEELQAEKDALAEELGRGLVAFLASQLDRRKKIGEKRGTGERQRRLVTKTPSVKNLGSFFRFFPAGQLVVLVRDGRSVVESSVKTFDQPYGYAALEWARAARTIQDFQAANPGGAYLLVRYEDLYSSIEPELRRIFYYLSLDPDTYDYSAAANMPIRGSSTLRDNGTSSRQLWVAKGIHWNPVEKPADFNPVDRWSSWSRAKHERFNWLAGEYLSRFGYALRTYPGSDWLWCAWNVILDISHLEAMVWLLRRAIRRLKTISSIGELLAFVWARVDLNRNQP